MNNHNHHIIKSCMTSAVLWTALGQNYEVYTFPVAWSFFTKYSTLQTNHNFETVLDTSSSSVALPVLARTLAASHRRFRKLIKVLGRTPFDEWYRKGFYLHRPTQHRNTKTKIHASSGIQTHDPSNQAARTCALDHIATGTSILDTYRYQIPNCPENRVELFFVFVCVWCDWKQISLWSGTWTWFIL
jgi:hypothetical protein